MMVDMFVIAVCCIVFIVGEFFVVYSILSSIFLVIYSCFKPFLLCNKNVL